MGALEDSMTLQAAKAGREPPAKILKAPTLFPWLDPYYNAFEELSFGRDRNPMTGLPNSIPWVWVDKYHRRNRYLDFDTLLVYIRVLDNKFRELEGDEIKRARDRNKEE